MPTRAVYRAKVSNLTAAENAAPIYVDSDDNELKIAPNGPGSAEFTIPTLEVTAGTVTQVGSISATVTLNASRGQVTTVSSTLATGAEATFTVSNSEVNPFAGSVIAVNIATYAGNGTPVVFVTNQAVGEFAITISNLHAIDSLNAALIIAFAVL